ncbi:Response regulator protein VraR [Sporotomaculum syntrophicum]|uniref:Stage 0 sporulation protein A homolog n=1 Tax=Sporotomaculum syntrophicum TaxID=182264 RepID=A0A9D2WSF5_9FIRM|nr:response regulator transcription factor [Sporotomaculum syntrophicum]KAF1085762.1 Response regulator protein VraR [Sporotomaculum syntrophicum]
MSQIRIMIVDDHPMIREGLATMLATCDDINIVGACESGDEANIHAPQMQPDIILMDIKMKGTNGIDAAKQILKNLPQVKIIFLTVFEDAEFMRQALQVGAVGYILKNVTKEKLIESIRRAHRGETIIDPTVFNTIVNDYIKLSNLAEETEEDAPPKLDFTPREKEILYHLTMGMTNKEISATTHLAVDTIKTHLRNIFRKMSVKNRSQAINHGIKYFNSHIQ